MPQDELVKVTVVYDVNDHGERAWLVTPFYRTQHGVVSVPDSRGWPTQAEAEAHAGVIRDDAERVRRAAECRCGGLCDSGLPCPMRDQ